MKRIHRFLSDQIFPHWEQFLSCLSQVTLNDSWKPSGICITFLTVPRNRQARWWIEKEWIVDKTANVWHFSLVWKGQLKQTRGCVLNWVYLDYFDEGNCIQQRDSDIFQQALDITLAFQIGSDLVIHNKCLNGAQLIRLQHSPSMQVKVCKS